MKILVSSHFFYPSVGGIETSSEVLAREFVRAGHEVTILTSINLSGSIKKKFPFKVVRTTNPLQIFKLFMLNDLIFMNCISLKHVWANLFFMKPCIITFNGLFGGNQILIKVKYFFMKLFQTVSVSKGIGCFLDNINYQVIHNSYNSNVFFRTNLSSSLRPRQLVFVGRLIPEKGLDIVFRALALLKAKKQEVALSIIGSGDDEKRLSELAKSFGIQDLVKFLGQKTGTELREILNQHQVLIIPSNCPEAFGIVALEGIACGCAVIASNCYGLPEAVGPCGTFFKMGDHKDCAKKIEFLVDNLSVQKELIKNSKMHLEHHVPKAIAGKYLELFDLLLEKQ
jgi:glycosyltransferase involved in cell wall biosynthesis